MRPTPGPYKITPVKFNDNHSFAVESDKPIATFWGPIFAGNASEGEARANAEALIAGIAALSGIERLRQARENYGRNVIPTDAEHKELMDAIDDLLRLKP